MSGTPKTKSVRREEERQQNVSQVSKPDGASKRKGKVCGSQGYLSRSKSTLAQEGAKSIEPSCAFRGYALFIVPSIGITKTFLRCSP
jgi:hypothetical protein